MADEPNEEQTKAKFIAWMNETLDARETKAAALKAESDAATEKEAAKKRTKEPANVLRQLLGF